MSRERGYNHDHEDSFPRVSGDEPDYSRSDQMGPVFSPRERG